MHTQQIGTFDGFIDTLTAELIDMPDSDVLEAAEAAENRALALEIVNNALTQAVQRLESGLIASMRKARRQARTHYSVAPKTEGGNLDGYPKYRAPLCGQRNGRQDGPAETHYSYDTARVDCKKCKRASLFKSEVLLQEMYLIAKPAAAVEGGAQ